MDLVNGFLNIFGPIFTVNVFWFLFPAYICFESLSYVLRSIFSENVAGKVVVIAGASSGIGEHLAYEYGKRGAYLVIGARREKSLEVVADKAHWFGSPKTIPIRTDVSKVEDCQRLIQEAIKNFGRLDHLVIPAGVTPASMFEDLLEVKNFTPSMVTYFVKMLCPEAVDWFNRWFCITEPGVDPREAISKKVVDLPGVKDIVYPDSVRSPKIKSN